MPELPDDDRAILEFEEVWSRPDGKKQELIRDRFNLSAARYYQRLNLIINNPSALEASPMLVHRLLRQRDARVRARAERSLRR